MKRLNRRFAGNDIATDVLAFPSTPMASGEDPYLGDIVISVEMANRQKVSTLEEELRILALHGLLHLLGYDHTVDLGEMRQFEAQLRREFELP